MSARNMAKRTAAGTLALAVCLGGGALALAGAANADSNFSFNTANAIYGADRYGTAISISQATFKSATDVVLVDGYDQVDGLTASSLAGAVNGPILYIDGQNGASPAVQAEIKRLGAKNVWLIGGTAKITSGVQAAISGGGLNVKRIGGTDRYDTAAQIADASIAANGGKAPAGVFLASGTSLADALAASPVAFAKDMPILLTDQNSTSSYTTAELGKLNPSTKVALGGTAVISDSTVASLGATRVTGADRGETANRIADWAVANAGFRSDSAILVGGANGAGADSLAGSTYAGTNLIPMHFSGWASTQTYLQQHSAQLTGKGIIIGGPAAVAPGDVALANTAAQSVAAAAGMVVTAVPTGSSTTFGYADPVKKQQTKVTPLATDKFMVGGAAATQGAFINSLTVGATVAITAPAATGGPTTYSLTPAPAAGFWSGLVGAYTPSSGSGVSLGATALAASNIAIVEPITGVSLNTFAYGGSYTLYTVDGQSVSQAIFESSLSVGDSIAVTGTGADAGHIRTVALTSGSLTGTIAAANVSGGILSSATVQTAAGAVLNIPLPGSGDTVSIDGTASTSTAYVGAAAQAGPPAVAAVVSPVSVGDQITFSRSGGVQKFALVNAAPSSVSGVIAATTSVGSTSGTGVTYYSPVGTPVLTTYPATARYVVNGTVAAKADFVAAATAGSWITYQAGDSTTNTTPSFTVVSKPLSGTVTLDLTNTSSANHTLAIADSDGDTLTGALNAANANLSYISATSVFSTGTSVAYMLEGNTATQAQFDAAVGRIASGARTGAVQVSIANGVVTWSLSTTAFTTAPTVTGATFTRTANGTPGSLVLTFNKPVTGSSTAPTDWTVMVGSTAVTVTSVTIGSGATANVVTLATAGSAAQTTAGPGTVVSVGSATTAAAVAAGHYLDTYGSAMSTSSFSFTAQ